MLPRWEACLTARQQQKIAFSGGQADVETAKRVTWTDKEIPGLIATIEGRIKDGVGGHDKQIALVQGSIAKCKPFAGATNAQQNKRQ